VKELISIGRNILGHMKDVAPLLVVIAFFQGAVLRQPLPDLPGILFGLVLLVVGLGLFMRGLEIALFPAGESIGRALVRMGSLRWLFIFSFLVGFGTAMAEPALITVADRVAFAVVEAGMISETPRGAQWYALGFRLSVALGVGSALMLGVLRTVKGWPLHRLLAGGVLVIALILPLAPTEFSAVALDAGPVTLSTITVPLVTALGIGLASSIAGRNPLTDGFGLVALTAILPALFVLAYGALAGALA
jgi:hypothetical protein